MNELKIFENQEFGTIRTITDKVDNVWFCGKDVAEALGYERATKAILDHVDREDTHEVPIQDSIGRMQNTPFINESGLYSLVLSSKLESAKRFKRWVTCDVLPSIRKHGIYATDQIIDNILADPDFGIKLLTDLKEERQARIKAEQKIAEQLPKVEYFDCLVDRKLNTTFRNTAKELGIKEKKLIKWLLDKKFVFRDIESKLKPYAQYGMSGEKLFEVKDIKSHKNSYAGHQTYITVKGKETFRLLLEKEGLI